VSPDLGDEYRAPRPHRKSAYVLGRSLLLIADRLRSYSIEADRDGRGEIARLLREGADKIGEAAALAFAVAELEDRRRGGGNAE
jgi:hypothetical protein